MGWFADDERMDRIEHAQDVQRAKMYLQEVRLKAVETGEPPDVVAVLKEATRWLRDPYRVPLLDYAIDLLEGKAKDRVPEKALP